MNGVLPVFLGMYAAAFDCQVEWIVIKGISHYTDGSGSGTEGWSRFASVMAASVAVHILKEPDILKDWPHYDGKNLSLVLEGRNNYYTAKLVLLSGRKSEERCRVSPCTKFSLETGKRQTNRIQERFARD